MVHIFLADGFEDIEAIAPLDILRRANIEVKTVGVSGKSVTSSHRVTVQADILLEDVMLDGCEMLVLPGGSGFAVLEKSETVLELIRKAHDNGIILAAICAAPTILARLGLLNGRRAVCFPSMEDALIQNGARVQPDETVTHDDHIITAQAAGSSFDFGLKLVSMLRGWAAAETVRKGIYYNNNRRDLT
ncbi:MAG: DJ-1/PfpI family protein [Oscillospiraceae bacterium]|nr:DJ-1/PfpI family protein [Oscillospiraceae bacterium]